MSTTQSNDTNQAKPKRSIAYFSMEIGLDSSIPTYSGGLGVLAGDTIKSMADAGSPAVAVTLVYHKGYFTQTLNTKTLSQESNPTDWKPSDKLQSCDKEGVAEFAVPFFGKKIWLKAWRYDCVGVTGKTVPVYFLDCDTDKNSTEDRRWCDSLYGGDERYRIAQEIILGFGGIALLKQLKLDIKTHHLNEGHASFLTLALLEESCHVRGKTLADLNSQDMNSVTERCVFTTHTPVAAGHDRFYVGLVEEALGSERLSVLRKLEVFEGPKSDMLNMTHLALRFARFTNGVAKRHGEVSRKLFPGHSISAITNGIHAATWISEPFAKLFDAHIPEWRKDNYFLRFANEIPSKDFMQARKEAKKILFDEVKAVTGQVWRDSVYTIGFARRAATYKRADLIFKDMAQLQKIADKWGGLQICFSGKAHPKDEGGKQLIHNVLESAKALEGSNIQVVYLPNYNMRLGRIICAGVDVWLNNPVKPMEASGTSGMKSTLNGVPSLSTLDGWWVEGLVEGVTGWEIEDAEDGFAEKSEAGVHSDKAAKALYQKLDSVILPMYFEKPEAYLNIMRQTVALNATYFNTQRMVEQYDRLAWR